MLLLPCLFSLAFSAPIQGAASLPSLQIMQAPMLMLLLLLPFCSTQSP
jgi:hypothetical protein